MTNQRRVSRRMFLGGGIGVAGLASNLVALSIGPKAAEASPAIITIPNISEASIGSKTPGLPPSSMLASLPFMGAVDPKVNGFDPTQILTIPNAGKISRLPTGQTLREFTLTAVNKSILVAPGKKFDALAYNGQVPGPTLRATAGDHIRITLINQSNTAHGLNFSGIHSGAKDALAQPVAPGKSMVYEFDAEPFGLYIYRGIALPLNTTAFKGLYGMLIVDPPATQPRLPAKELFMALNGFTLDSGGGTAPDDNSTKL
ncbi:MAG TPA: multicopper oxidase domain-containing protein, partial [Ktedonobacteraceae bacterium]|nr:multicopper oxidase domain-containing protein [Ktedonobacteraceae bacterium]